jgi:arabinose-5-phosphate isomerase
MSQATSKPLMPLDAKGETDPALGPQASDGTLAAVRRTLEIEAQALETLRGSLEGDLGQSMTAAVELISAALGHVVVTGMGKSGHVGRKIAATMASTGTPAFFVHPGEASHGDLGMITRDNVVVALSNSGETTELSDLLIYTRRFSIPLIAITSVAESTLAREADVALVLPPVEEACPLGLAPTSSTTLSLVVGDALAVALLDRRGFSRENFREFHPGGRLGNVLQRVRDIMHTGSALPLVERGLPMSEVLIAMSARGFGCVGVVESDGTLGGIVTDGDLRRHLSAEILDSPVDRVMTAQPRVITPDALAAEALKTMQDTRINALFVCEEGQRVPVGFLHLHDCLRSGVY